MARRLRADWPTVQVPQVLVPDGGRRGTQHGRRDPSGFRGPAPVRVAPAPGGVPPRPGLAAGGRRVPAVPGNSLRRRPGHHLAAGTRRRPLAAGCGFRCPLHHLPVPRRPLAHPAATFRAHGRQRRLGPRRPLLQPARAARLVRQLHRLAAPRRRLPRLPVPGRAPGNLFRRHRHHPGRAGAGRRAGRIDAGGLRPLSCRPWRRRGYLDRAGCRARARRRPGGVHGS